MFMGKRRVAGWWRGGFLRGFFGVPKNFYGGLLLGHDDQELLASYGFYFDFEILVEEGFDGVFVRGGDGQVPPIVCVSSFSFTIAVFAASTINLDQPRFPPVKPSLPQGKRSSTQRTLTRQRVRHETKPYTSDEYCGAHSGS